MNKENVADPRDGVVFSHKKKNEIMSFSGKQMERESIMSAEVSRTQKKRHMWKQERKEKEGHHESSMETNRAEEEEQEQGGEGKGRY